MARIVVLPVAVIGILSLLALARLGYVAVRHRVPFGLLMNMFLHGMPIGLMCRVKRSMEEWGLKIDMQEIVDAYLRRLQEGDRTYAAQEEELRQTVIKVRTGRA